MHMLLARRAIETVCFSCKERSYKILFAIASLPFARALKKPGNVLGAVSSMYSRTSA